MGPNALLVCAERQSLKVLESLLDELEISHDACHCCADAMERAVRGQYSALVLDFDLEGCAQLGKLARMAAPQQRSVLFALVGASTPLNDTSHAGANVVLYKPLNLDQVRCSLRAGRELMRADRRRDSRHRVETLVYLQFGIAAMPALVLDLSEQGLALQTPGAVSTGARRAIALRVARDQPHDRRRGRGDLVRRLWPCRPLLFAAQTEFPQVFE